MAKSSSPSRAPTDSPREGSYKNNHNNHNNHTQPHGEPPGPQVSPSYPFRWSTFLCRGWWTSCRKSSSSSSHCLLLPSRVSKCPRSLLRTPSRSERRSGLRSWRNSWWKCQCLPSATASSSRRCRRVCCHGTGPQMASNGATAQGPEVSTGGSRVRDTPSGPIASSGRYINTGQG